MATGTCNCAAISFEIRTDLSEVIVCHCSICRRSTGSNGIAVVIVSNDGFSWLRGDEFVTSWKKPDADWEKWFCRQCGSPVPGMNDENHMFVPAGTINDGGDNLKVTHHIFVGSKACWDVIGDSGHCHPEAYE